MHELPAVTELINTLEEEAEKHSLKSITRVVLKVGELSSMESECVRYYFELLSEDRLMQGASLEFERVPARLKCRDCGAEFDHEKSFDCPKCGKSAVLIKGTGREFLISTVEGETG